MTLTAVAPPASAPEVGAGTDARGAAVPSVVWFVIALGAVCLLGAAVAAFTGPVPSLPVVLAAAACTLIGDAAVLHIRFGHDQDSFTLAEIGLIVGIVLLPTAWLVLVAAVAVAASHAMARRTPIKVVFNAASYVVAAFLASSIFALIAGNSGSLLLRVEALIAASAVFFLWNSTTIAWAVASSQRLPVWRVYSSGLLLCVFVWVGNTAVALALVVLAESGSALVWAIPLLLGVLCLMYWSYLHAMNERDLWQLLQTASRELLHAEPSGIGPVVVEHTPALFSAEFTELVLVEHEDSEDAVVFRWHGGDDIQVFEMSPVAASPFWAAALAGREPFEADAATAPRVQRKELATVGLEKCIVAPLLVGSRCLGMLRIGFRGRVRFTAREMQVLTTFSNHVSATVHNTRLFETLRAQALHDPLTGLANRTVLLDRLEQAQARAARSQDKIAVIFLDLDRFKMVNDSLGHEAGDELLVEVANRIRGCLRPGDTAARLGGDEFVIVCEGISTPAHALEIGNRISDSVSAAYALAGQDVYISASVGISLADASGNAEELLRDADTAMYHAKARGRSRCELFDEELREDVTGRLRLEQDLRLAVQREELRLVYQPNVTLAGQDIVGAEALLRWQHPERGLVMPAEFIPIAEDTGAIVDIGRWVISEACEQLADWVARGMFSPSAYMSINLSALQLAHPDLVDDVAAVLARTGVDPAMVCFEVTEGALVRDLAGARETLGRLRDLGARTALDDFGTGYSSLSYLQQLPVDVLKLDQSFIARLTPDSRDRAVVAGMVDLAHALDLTVIAEGVETQQQLDDLRSLSCDVGQGFHFFAPQTADALEQAMAPGPLAAA